tara:strand:- start:3223 stop:3396 length:174 start_codon:yes stop_codon:yes gene_type:complete
MDNIDKVIKRKEYMKKYYIRNQDKYKKESHNQYIRNKGMSNIKGLEIKRGKIIIDFN